MLPPDPVALLQQQYPLYAAGRDFYAIFALTGTLFDGPSRVTLAEIFTLLATALDALATGNLGVFIAPQLVRVQGLAQDCREFAVILNRYAALSRGHVALTMTPDASGALARAATDTTSLLTLLHGVRIY